MTKPLLFKDWIWGSVHIQLKWNYAGNLWNHPHCGLQSLVLLCGHLCDQSWQWGLSPVLQPWPCGLGWVLKGLTLLSLPFPHFWAFRSLWRSWRNIPIYEPALYFCDKAERIKSPCCIFFPHLGTRALTADVGFVFPTRVAVPSSCTLLFIRVLEGCLASCSHFPQTNGKPGGKRWDTNRSVSKALPSAA